MAQMTTAETESFNRLVDRWGFKTRAQLKASVAKLTMHGKRKLVTQLQYQTKKDFGEIDRVIFNFPRHGVFFHKGVGRGYIIVANTLMRGQRLDKTHSANKPGNALILPASGPLKRHPKDWFNPVFSKAVPALADLIAQTKADHIFDQKNLKLNT